MSHPKLQAPSFQSAQDNPFKITFSEVFLFVKRVQGWIQRGGGSPKLHKEEKKHHVHARENAAY